MRNVIREGSSTYLRKHAIVTQEKWLVFRGKNIICGPQMTTTLVELFGRLISIREGVSPRYHVSIYGHDKLCPKRIAIPGLRHS